MTKPLGDQVVVIVGASSGIGRKAALGFAAAGASVVVAARDHDALEELVSQMTAAGGDALAIRADVVNWDDVNAVAERAVERFGRIDTWVNAAAVSVFGDVADVAMADLDRVLQVGLLGQVHGVKTALPIMRRQGGGTIIGIGSVLGLRGIPVQAAYSAAKHGVEGFYESVRMEERLARSGVRLTTILPSSINTPFYDDVKSCMSERPAPLPPLYHPEAVAEAILHAAVHPGRHVIVGGTGAFLALLQRLSPALTDHVLSVGGQVKKRQRRGEPDRGQSNLYRPPPGPRRVHGSFGHLSMRRSLYTRLLAQHPERMRVAGVVGAATLARRLTRSP